MPAKLITTGGRTYLVSDGVRRHITYAKRGRETIIYIHPTQEEEENGVEISSIKLSDIGLEEKVAMVPPKRKITRKK